MMNRTTFALVTATLAAGIITACEPKESAEARSTTMTPAQATAAPTPPSASKVAFRFVTAPTGNSARYRIREQLAGLDLPNDAVGETSGVTGVIATDASGQLIPAESRFTVDVSSLTSDKDRRDGFVRRRVLETERFPTVTFVPTAIRGVSFPLPASGTRKFDMVGNLTVKGTTRPTTWRATAQFQQGRMTGSAATAFTFRDFAMDQPRVPVVLSVADTIRLELDFSLVQEAVKK